MSDPQPIDFDLQAAWLRRFQADAEGNLRAFALRLHEAMPDRVVIQENKGLFARTGKITGLTVELGDSRYALQLAGGRLQASVSMVVRGITLNTKSVDPAIWFAQLEQETQKASEHARRLSQSISSFMAS